MIVLVGAVDLAGPGRVRLSGPSRAPRRAERAEEGAQISPLRMLRDAWSVRSSS